MPITKLTLDDMTFGEYLRLLRSHEHSTEADELQEQIPEVLGEPYSALTDQAWGIIQDKLKRKTDAEIAKVLGQQQGYGDEVMLGVGVDPKEALSLMKQNDFAWNHFKTLQSLQLRK